MKENWKDVVDYEGLYQVSNLGKVRGLRVVTREGERITGWEKKTGLNGKGYRMCTLSKNGKSKSKLVHRLVAESFLEVVKEKEYVDHIDGNKLNNRLDNLRWCTMIENSHYHYENNNRYNSKHLGVTVNKDGYVGITMRVDGVSHSLHGIKTEEEAKVIYNEASMNGVDVLKKYKKFGTIGLYSNNRWVFSYNKNKTRYMASFKTEEDAKTCRKDCKENGIWQINKYKAERFKYSF